MKTLLALLLMTCAVQAQQSTVGLAGMILTTNGILTFTTAQNGNGTVETNYARFSTTTNLMSQPAAGLTPNLNVAFETAPTNNNTVVFALATLPTDGNDYVEHTIMVSKAAGDQAIIFPAPYRTNIAGTVMRCTNFTKITIEWQANLYTNVFCSPRN